MPAGRFKPKTYRHPAPPKGTPTTGTHRPPPGVRGPAKSDVQRAGEKLGRAVSGGAHTVSEGAQEGPIRKVIKEAKDAQVRRRAQELNALRQSGQISDKTFRAALRAARNEPLQADHKKGILDAAKQAARETTDFYKGIGKEAVHAVEGVPSPRKVYDFAREPGQKKYERTTDVIAGKSLSNLAFHGDTSHLPEAGLEAGALLPIGKGIKALGIGAKAARAAEEARAVEEAAAAGEHLVHGPPAPSAQEKLQGFLPGMKQAAAKQRRAVSHGRGLQAQRAEEAFQAAEGQGIQAQHKAAMVAKKGELVKPPFQLLAEGNLPEQQYEQLLQDIHDSHLQRFSKDNAGEALRKAYMEEKAPRAHEIKLLEEVFGPEEVAPLRKEGLGSKASNALGVARSLNTTLDLSLNLRQALPLLFRNPKVWSKSLKPQVKSLVREKNFQAAEDVLHADPDFQEAVKIQPRLFTSIEERGGLHRSEFYPSPYAEKIPLVKHPVRASGRAYEIGQNTNILNSYKTMKARAAKWGINIDPHTAQGKRELRGMLEVAGAQTGRGIFHSKTFKGAQPLLGQGLFAPSFYKSRLTWFSPRWYAKLPKVARYEAARTMLQFLGGSAAVLGGAAAAGAKVSHDPRSADFGKVRIGDTRLDTMGGFQQWGRLATQIATGKYVDTNTGRVIDLKPGIGNRTRWDVAMAFATGKASPPASVIIDFFKGTDYQYRPFSWKREAVQRMTPLVLQDMVSVYQATHSPAAAAGAYFGGAAGLGVQQYSSSKESPGTIKEGDKIASSFEKEGAPAGYVSKVKASFKLAAARDAYYTNATKGLDGKKYAKAKFEANLKFLTDYGRMDNADAKAAKDWSDNATWKELDDANGYLSKKYYTGGPWDVVSEARSYYEKQRKAR